MIPDILCKPLIMLFGILYPGYMSYKVLKSKRSSNYGIWIMYWITFAMFTSVETITDIFIGPWFPFYNELKLLFIYMTYPTSDRSLTIVYSKIISPFLKRHEKNIDFQINNFKNGGLKTLMATGKKCTNILLNLIIKASLTYGIQMSPLQIISMNQNNAITTNEISEPDGNNDILYDDVDDSEDDSSSDGDSLDLSVQEEPPAFLFSEMYGNNENKNELIYDPPASNTRRRKRAN